MVVGKTTRSGAKPANKGPKDKPDPAKAVKNRKHKIQRFLDKRAPLTVENNKKALILRGHNTSQVICDVLTDVQMLTKPNCKALSRKNDILPFEDASSLEFLCTKADCSLFALGSHTKKRPNNLVLGRMFDGSLMDMFEFGVDNFNKIGSMAAETGSKSTKATGSKPMFVFLGEKWETDTTFVRMQNMLVDFFRANRVEKISLKGLDNVMGWTVLEDGRVYCRVYTVSYKRSGTRIPDVELLPMGPFLDLSVRRSHLAAADMWNAANKQAKNVNVAKKVKNITHNSIGDKVGTIHMSKQKLGGMITKGRKMKVLRK
jgi:ribosome production factor 2